MQVVHHFTIICRECVAAPGKTLSFSGVTDSFELDVVPGHSEPFMVVFGVALNDSSDGEFTGWIGTADREYTISFGKITDARPIWEDNQRKGRPEAISVFTVSSKGMEFPICGVYWVCLNFQGQPLHAAPLRVSLREPGSGAETE